jgi:class 3 adenylate cyclase
MRAADCSGCLLLCFWPIRQIPHPLLKEPPVPLYMDVHEIEGVTADDVARAHHADLGVQSRHGVSFHHYWVNEESGKVFCVCSAPSAEAAVQVHRESHGLVPGKVIEIDQDVHDAMMGRVGKNAADAVVSESDGKTALDNPVRMVMFTDIVDSTTFAQQMGDEAAMDLVEHHDMIVRDALKAHSGREVKHMGDGIMASFSSAVLAARCAARIHRDITVERAHPDFPSLRVRIGIAAGEPVMKQNDLFGCTVQLAARLCQFAAPGESAVSAGVADLCGGKGVQFQDRGDHTLKGFDRPQRVFTLA